MECLREHREDLSDACRKEELHLNIIQARDVRLRPKLRKICAHEMAAHCKDVPRGARSPWSGCMIARTAGTGSRLFAALFLDTTFCMLMRAPSAVSDHVQLLLRNR